MTKFPQNGYSMIANRRGRPARVHAINRWGTQSACGYSTRSGFWNITTAAVDCKRCLERTR